MDTTGAGASHERANLFHRAVRILRFHILPRQDATSSPEMIHDTLSAATFHSHLTYRLILPGDAYIGGFLSGWSKGFSDINCMKIGTAVASAKLSKKGAREGLPSLLELKTRLNALINHKAETKE